MRKIMVAITILFLTGVYATAQDQQTAQPVPVPQPQNGAQPAADQPVDFGDKTSSTLTTKAWAALAKNDVNMVETYVNKTVELYGDKAKEMQASLKEYAWESNTKIFSYWALNDVGTSLFILGEAYQNAGRKDDATKAYNRVINEFGFSQCWDPQGWFWKPAEAAQKKLDDLKST